MMTGSREELSSNPVITFPSGSCGEGGLHTVEGLSSEELSSLSSLEVGDPQEDSNP